MWLQLPAIGDYTARMYPLSQVVQLVEISVGRWWCLLPSLLGGKRSEGRWIIWHREIWITLPTPAWRNMALSRCWKLIFPYWNVEGRDNSMAALRWNCWELMINTTRRFPSQLNHNYSISKKDSSPFSIVRWSTKFYLGEGREVALLSLTLLPQYTRL